MWEEKGDRSLTLSRREFLKALGVIGAGGLVPWKGLLGPGEGDVLAIAIDEPVAVDAPLVVKPVDKRSLRERVEADLSKVLVYLNGQFVPGVVRAESRVESVFGRVFGADPSDSRMANLYPRRFESELLWIGYPDRRESIFGNLLWLGEPAKLVLALPSAPEMAYAADVMLMNARDEMPARIPFGIPCHKESWEAVATEMVSCDLCFEAVGSWWTGYLADFLSGD